MRVDIRKMFYPDSVAVVGASAGELNMGKNIVQNLINWEYAGRIFPVNPRGENVLGLKGYSSLEEIAQKIDLVVSFVPAPAVPGVIDSCAARGVRCMAIPSGGFAELGEEGRRLTGVIGEKAREAGIRFVGPNGLTIINAENGLCLPFLTFRKREPGSISIISQSGGVGVSLVMFLDNSSATFNKFISVGNKVDLDELDFLEYLGGDPGTKVICMFLESVVRGRQLVEAAKRIDKPILLYKANTTEVGARTAASHTAALANDDKVIDGALKQAGVIRVREIRKLMELARAFELPPMSGNRIAVISQAGGYTVLCADEAFRHGFEFPALTEACTERMRDFVRSDVIRLGNPLDLGDIHSTDAILRALDSVLEQEDIDGAALVLLRRSDARYTGAYARMAREPYADIEEIMNRHGKPIALCLLSQSEFIRDVQDRTPYPVFASPEVVVQALAASRDYHARSSDTPPAETGVRH